MAFVMRFPINALCLPILLVLLVACGSSSPVVTQELDPLTGVTVRRATEPVILFRDDSSYAAYARNFVYMGPIEVNRMGSYTYYLWFGVWNTIRDDERMSPDRDGFESAVIVVDGTPLPLELAGWTPDAIGVSQPVYLKPVAGASDAYYRVTLDQIRMIARANDIELHVGQGVSRTYLPWDGQNATRDSFGAF
jgi:hypothetical protein